MTDDPRDDREHRTDQDPEPTGPTDQGREGGMATRELAPELTEPDRGPDEA